MVSLSCIGSPYFVDIHVYGTFSGHFVRKAYVYVLLCRNSFADHTYSTYILYLCCQTRKPGQDLLHCPAQITYTFVTFLYSMGTVRWAVLHSNFDQMEKSFDSFLSQMGLLEIKNVFFRWKKYVFYP